METEKETQQKISLKKEIADKSIGYITAGLSVVAGLTWNDAIIASLEVIFPTDRGTIIAKFGYALIFTVILVLVTIQLNKFMSRLIK